MQGDKKFNLIINRVCYNMDITVKELMSSSRKRNIVDARKMSCFLLKKIYLKNMPLKEIGRKIGNRDHSSILYLIEGHISLMQTDSNYAEKYIDIKSDINHSMANVTVIDKSDVINQIRVLLDQLEAI